MFLTISNSTWCTTFIRAPQFIQQCSEVAVGLEEAGVVPRTPTRWSILSICTMYCPGIKLFLNITAACLWRLWGLSPRFWFGGTRMIHQYLSEYEESNKMGKSNVIEYIMQTVKVAQYNWMYVLCGKHSFFFSFFLEKNMLSFFLRIMRQRSGGSSYVCVQLLQTLNILFENIRNETSLCMCTTFFAVLNANVVFYRLFIIE